MVTNYHDKPKKKHIIHTAYVPYRIKIKQYHHLNSVLKLTSGTAKKVFSILKIHQFDGCESRKRLNGQIKKQYVGFFLVYHNL